MGITKQSSHQKIYEAYIKERDEVRRLKRLHGVAKEAKKNVINKKNERYNKLSYKLYREKQRVYGKERHIDNIKGKILITKLQSTKKGYEKAMAQIREKDARIIKMYQFIPKLNTVIGIMDMSIIECAFILWAGSYNFYSSKDFKRDFPVNPGYKFYVVNNRMVKEGYIVPLENRDLKMKLFALSGTGMSAYEKLSKFTKKQFE